MESNSELRMGDAWITEVWGGENKEEMVNDDFVVDIELTGGKEDPNLSDFLTGSVGSFPSFSTFSLLDDLMPDAPGASTPEDSLACLTASFRASSAISASLWRMFPSLIFSYSHKPSISGSSSSTSMMSVVFGRENKLEADKEHGDRDNGEVEEVDNGRTSCTW